MSARDLHFRSEPVVPHSLSRTPTGIVRPSALYLVTSYELQNLRHFLDRGVVPVDFADKLERLAKADLLGQSIERQCRLFMALLKAAGEAGFNQASKAECERLLKVLAYVRKDDDA